METTSFVVVFKNKSSRKTRLDTLEQIRDSYWWQETSYGNSDRLNHVRVTVNDPALLKQAMEQVKGFDGVATVERVEYLHYESNGSGARLGPAPEMARGFAALRFDQSKMDELLLEQVNQYKDQDPDVDEVLLDLFVETVEAVDQSTVDLLSKLGVNARVTTEKATFTAECSLRTIALLTQEPELIEKLLGSRSYQAL